jgi:hypothetical protein
MRLLEHRDRSRFLLTLFSTTANVSSLSALRSPARLTVFYGTRVVTAT